MESRIPTVKIANPNGEGYLIINRDRLKPHHVLWGAEKAVKAAKADEPKPVAPKPEAPAQTPPQKDGQIEIPDDWRDAKFFTQRALAEKLSGTRPANKGEAVAMIEAEIAKRAA
tara:strand:+ start:132 stop:473 length:342 start_codon:yes stop_codon:yes gene_type:complete